jgi:3'-phosphoadenosine 5'-phosphosulfate sulfotransferase (PAPS reductase)/FAD synthetase
LTDYVAFTSYGNDSLALLQLIREYRLPEQRKVVALYSDTGWASEEWSERVEKAEAFAQSIGIETARTESVGFEALVRDRKIFPRGQAQFCTSVLKIFPAQKWLKDNDPEALAICMNGVRRAESLRRRETPVFTPLSAAHGDRALWSPLAEFSDEARNVLIERTGFDVLPHRSKECNPCIFANRGDLRGVPSRRVDTIRTIEQDLGDRTMYRPKAYAGAHGIDEVIAWANAERGQFKGSDFIPNKAPPVDDDEADCDSGFCGG